MANIKLNQTQTIARIEEGTDRILILPQEARDDAEAAANPPQDIEYDNLRRQLGDDGIGTNNTTIDTINADIENAVNSIVDEVTERTTADATLQTNIDTEATTRATADTTLQANIDAEEQARVALHASLNTEEVARVNADATLQTNIDNEETARTSADTTLQTNIDNEATARITADNALSGRIDTVETANARARDWNSTTTYPQGAIVRSNSGGGTFMNALTSSTNQNPRTSSNWRRLDTTIQSWFSDENYIPGRIVKHNNKYWLRLVDNTAINAEPSASTGTKWLELNSGHVNVNSTLTGDGTETSPLGVTTEFTPAEKTKLATIHPGAGAQPPIISPAEIATGTSTQARSVSAAVLANLGIGTGGGQYVATTISASRSSIPLTTWRLIPALDADGAASHDDYEIQVWREDASFNDIGGFRVYRFSFQTLFESVDQGVDGGAVSSTSGYLEFGGGTHPTVQVSYVNNYTNPTYPELGAHRVLLLAFPDTFSGYANVAWSVVGIRYNASSSA